MPVTDSTIAEPAATADPPFRPHRLFRGGHAQTLAGYLLRERSPRYSAKQHAVALPDGDQIVLHDDVPPGWPADGRVVLLLHGLTGCHRSPYLERIAAKFNRRGVRTFRMDHRGVGAAARIAHRPYHAGRSEDVRLALERIAQLCPDAALAAAGFSLSGNIVLKLLGEDPDGVPANLDRAVAVNPPIDLAGCMDSIERFPNTLYNRYFLRFLFGQVVQLGRMTDDLPISRLGRRPQSLREFDDLYTAPASGFASAADYYARCSSAQFVPHIRLPVWILTAADDPLVPVAPFHTLAPPDNVRLIVSPTGGHMGYIARAGDDPDCRWMDWRVIEWLVGV